MVATVNGGAPSRRVATRFRSVDLPSRPSRSASRSSRASESTARIKLWKKDRVKVAILGSDGRSTSADRRQVEPAVRCQRRREDASASASAASRTSIVTVTGIWCANSTLKDSGFTADSGEAFLTGYTKQRRDLSRTRRSGREGEQEGRALVEEQVEEEVELNRLLTIVQECPSLEGLFF